MSQAHSCNQRLRLGWTEHQRIQEEGLGDNSLVRGFPQKMFLPSRRLPVSLLGRRTA